LLGVVAAGFAGGDFFSGGACAADFCGGGVTFPEAAGVSLADWKDLAERDDSELSRDGSVGSGVTDCFWFERCKEPEPLRRVSARFRRDSVLLRSIEARLSVGDRTIPVDLASPPVRMKPRIELDAVPVARSWTRSVSSLSLVEVMLFAGRVWEVVKVGAVRSF
jgi:hypothetical protein